MIPQLDVFNTHELEPVLGRFLACMVVAFVLGSLDIDPGPVAFFALIFMLVVDAAWLLQYLRDELEDWGPF